MNDNKAFEGKSGHEIALARVLKALLPAGNASQRSIFRACGRTADVTRALQTLREVGIIHSSGKFHVQYQLRDDIVQAFEAARARQEELRQAVGESQENERRLKRLRNEAYEGSLSGVIEAVCGAAEVYADRSGIQVDTKTVRRQLENIFVG
jgi:hypothetical protein